MKTLIVAVALVVTFNTAARGQTPTPEPGKRLTEEQELKALDLSWHVAVAARDEAALGRLLADDYNLNLDGVRTLTKTQEIEAVKASDPLFAFGAFKLGEVTVRIEGERAIVSGVLTTRPDGGDKNSRRRYFYTRTFVNRDGRRQILEARLLSLYADAR
ncbi:MAG TPA: nuclear transport factor 2 family protein [Pyrinomonadaceae bacterium]